MHCRSSVEDDQHRKDVTADFDSERGRLDEVAREIGTKQNGYHRNEMAGEHHDAHEQA